MNDFRLEGEKFSNFFFPFYASYKISSFSVEIYFELKKRGKNNLTQITPGTYKASKVSQALFCGNVEAAEKTNGKIENGIICKQKTVPSLQ